MLGITTSFALRSKNAATPAELITPGVLTGPLLRMRLQTPATSYGPPVHAVFPPGLELPQPTVITPIRTRLVKDMSRTILLAVRSANFIASPWLSPVMLPRLLVQRTQAGNEISSSWPFINRDRTGIEQGHPEPCKSRGIAQTPSPARVSGCTPHTPRLYKTGTEQVAF
jgi:hypothetical protein